MSDKLDQVHNGNTQKKDAKGKQGFSQTCFFSDLWHKI